MTHPLFRQDMFIETAFERRFQAMLRSAWHKRSWHVIVADPGSGKTMGIRDMIRTAGFPAILAVTAPKNDESEQALGNQLFTALGLTLRGRWSERKPKLMGSMVQFGVKCLIVDDAHDLSLAPDVHQGADGPAFTLRLSAWLMPGHSGEATRSPEGNTRSAGYDVAPIPPPPRQTRTVLSGGRPHQRRSPRDPGHPGNGVPAPLSQAQLAPMGRRHLHLAHASGPRSDPLRPRDDGLPDEAGDHGAGMDL